MKRTLLATASVLAVSFAGATAASAFEFEWEAEATLGYNDTVADSEDSNDGFYAELSLGLTATQELDNGITAGASFSFDIVDNSDTNDIETLGAGDWTLFLESDVANLYVGDVDPVADSEWGGVDGNSTADFNDQDVHFDDVGFDAMLRGEVMVMGANLYISYGLDFQDDGGLPPGVDEIDALQLAGSYEFDMYEVGFAYAAAVGDPEITPRTFGIYGTGTFNGITGTVSYLDDETETSIGFGVEYPFGPVVLGAYYSLNDPSDDSYGVSADYEDGPYTVSAFYEVDTGGDGDWGVEGIVDLEGFTGFPARLWAGTTEAGDDCYIAFDYDLGGGATFLVSYASDGGPDSEDEIGDPEFQEGLTLELNFVVAGGFSG